MKRQIITDVVQQMLPHLDNAQLKQLQKVLECTLFGCDITKQEEKENEVKINELQAELDNEQNRAVTSDMFLSSVRKYTRARKLTPRMLNELIDKIEVYQAEKIDGKKVQRLKIHYNCIGAIEIPDLSKLPENNVSVHTRQGVNVQYAALAV